eukprot:TRINITY_DN704_c0_g1_i8.p1 TRINITY_DN704_c0_g1~~TRINITY_DN704_c0_g1_i8.p1  ORF type:complete len:311 (-),score=55.97 TRINITY_DN704_c0_g1_i8:2545-3477(-)
MVSRFESGYVRMNDFSMSALSREEQMSLSNHSGEMPEEDEEVFATNGEIMDNGREENEASKYMEVTQEVVKRKRGRPPKLGRSGATAVPVRSASVGPDGMIQKRKRGRPPKSPRSVPGPNPVRSTSVGPDGVIQKRGRGRPRKIVKEAMEGGMQGGNGSAVMHGEEKKRKRGRRPKSMSAAAISPPWLLQNVQAPRGRGRPRKYPRGEDGNPIRVPMRVPISKEPKPKKKKVVVDREVPQRKRGRPPMLGAASSLKPRRLMDPTGGPRGRGRPRKYPVGMPMDRHDIPPPPIPIGVPVKRGRGRPRKADS